MAPKKRAHAKSKASQAVAVVPAYNGPRCLAELYQWPKVILDRLLCRDDNNNELRRARLQTLLSKRLLVTSDYSGLSGEAEILHQVQAVLPKFLSLPEGELVHHCSVCDHGQLQQGALLALSEHSGRKLCVFQDLADRLSPMAAHYVEAMRPNDSASVAEAASAYSSMAAWLMENRKFLLNSARTAWCVSHEAFCSVAAPCPVDDDEESARMLKVHFAGTTCRGWSSAGQQKFFGDKSEEAHGVWLAHRKLEAERTDGNAEDLIISECTVRYPSKADPL